MKVRHSNKRTGFTLAELMVVIVIIGLLVTVVAPNVMQRLTTAKWTKAKADIKVLDEAVESFLMQNQGRMPDSLEDLVQEDINGNTYLKQTTVPKDPWGYEYQFEQTGSTKYRIWTEGSDGAPGGEGDERDYDNIMLNNGE